jgi:hypothetical protein
MLLINHPPLGPAAPAHLKTLAAMQAIAPGRSAFFTTGAPGDDEREELWLGTRLFGLSVSKRAYLYMLRSHLGGYAPAVMNAGQRAKQLLLAGELFAGARNAYAKAELHEQAVVAYFLSMRCALRSGAPLPGYLQDMATHYAQWLGPQAEALALQRLQQHHDVPGFLAMTTIAASAYRDNTGPLGEAERKQRDTFTARHLTHLHEYLKAHQSKLTRTDVALVQRVMGLWAAVEADTPLPEWLQEVTGRAPGRAATGFLQEAAEQDKQRHKAAAAWWWAHAAEALTDTPQPEAWQRPFVESAPVEAAKRLSDLATAAKKPEVDLRERALWASACHRQTRSLQTAPSAAAESFRVQEMEVLAEDLRNELTGANTTAPSLGRGLEGALLAGMGATSELLEAGFTGERHSRDIVLGLKHIVESSGSSLPSIAM